ncbi:MAG: gliding motility-associated C-terminal domain-containing protein [Saprospiraceae bacterium]|nr:gliding motility-associated C-terminal domain-containing protein [Saprospiraceae bacterium]
MNKFSPLLCAMVVAVVLFSSFTHTATVTGVEACKWFVPNVFSPNDDGVNDTFLPYNDCGDALLNYELKIFSRWGRLVFETSSPDQGWNGKAKGKDLPAETYVYSIRYTISDDIEKETEVLSGDVALIR